MLANIKNEDFFKVDLGCTWDCLGAMLIIMSTYKTCCRTTRVWVYVKVQHMLSFYSCMGLCQSTKHVVVLLVYWFMSKYKTCCRSTRVLVYVKVQNMLSFYSCMGLCQSTKHVVVLLVYCLQLLSPHLFSFVTYVYGAVFLLALTQCLVLDIMLRHYL